MARSINETLGLIIGAHNSLSGGDPQAWVSLRQLRERLCFVDRGDLDAALAQGLCERDLHLIAEVNQKVLTAPDRAAALQFGGDDKHLYQVVDHST